MMKNRIAGTKRDVIIEAAKSVFIRHGYNKSTVQMIAEKAGTTRSLVNYYFPKKSDILVTMMGNYMNSINEYVLEYTDEDPLMVYMITHCIYILGMLRTPRSRAFQKDLSLRPDRDLGPYNNYRNMHSGIIELFELKYTEEELILKEAAIFGMHTELTLSWLNNVIDVSKEKLIETILINVCQIFGIHEFIVRQYIKRLWAEIDKLGDISHLVFH